MICRKTAAKGEGAMTVKELIDCNLFHLVNEGTGANRVISKPYCCDLLSTAMSSAPADGIWFTVMANLNTLAVASLTGTACIVLAQNTALDEPALAKAQSEGITVFSTELPSFDAAVLFWKKQNAKL